MPHESPKQTPFACFLLGSIILAVCSVHGQSVHCLMCLLLLIIIIRYKSPQIFSLLFFWFTEITTESIFISVFKRFLLSTLPKIQAWQSFTIQFFEDEADSDFMHFQQLVCLKGLSHCFSSQNRVFTSGCTVRGVTELDPALSHL